jgi:hypothetical protein
LNAGIGQRPQTAPLHCDNSGELFTDEFMTRKFYLSLIVLLLGLLLPVRGIAQSDSAEPSLGDLARSLRKGKPAPEHTVIDNDNLHKVMDEVQNLKLKGSLLFSIDGIGKKFQVSSPDVTCDLSFSASATSLLSDAYAPQDLPEAELAKLDGPATIAGDALQVSVHNGTSWNIKEITVGLTILRDSGTNATRSGAARLIPASETTALISEKHPDVTVLYHLKGSSAPSSTTVFHETLNSAPSHDQEWHWAIVQAKGIPAPKPAASNQQLTTDH